jgi:hypothetical protein
LIQSVHGYSFRKWLKFAGLILHDSGRSSHIFFSTSNYGWDNFYLFAAVFSR